tara:strand:+ start:6522 stop:7193 length:672 start_codon:yes stop_codon:yes gene_type:complete
MNKNDYRVEKKFVITPIEMQYCDFWLLNNGRNLIEKYPPRKVNSIYFDTYNLNHYHDNITGLSSRSKFRLRWYGENTNDFYWEHKEKVKKYIKKNVCKINGNTIQLNNLSNLYNKIMFQLPSNERMDFLHSPSPSAFVSYHRRYFESSSGVRLTIDSRQILQNLWQQKKISMSNVWLNEFVIEIKHPFDIERKEIKFLSTFPFNPSRNSKYINACNGHMDNFQ